MVTYPKKVFVTTQSDSICTIGYFLNQAKLSLQTANCKEKLRDFYEKFEKCVNCLFEYDLIVDDPSGYSFVENTKDQNLEVTNYSRSKEQNETIGMSEKRDSDSISLDDDSDEHIDSVFSHDTKVSTFPAHCSCCSIEGTMRSCTLIIPRFKEIVILTFSCEKCGYRKA